MRAVDVDRHLASLEFVIDTRSLWPKANERDLIGSFRKDVDEIILIWFDLRLRLLEIRKEKYC